MPPDIKILLNGKAILSNTLKSNPFIVPSDSASKIYSLIKSANLSKVSLLYL